MLKRFENYLYFSKNVLLLMSHFCHFQPLKFCRTVDAQPDLPASAETRQPIPASQEAGRKLPVPAWVQPGQAISPDIWECAVVLIDKPSGWTSFDVVAKLRGAIRIKKVDLLL